MGERILIVDDEVAIRGLIAAQLQHLPYELVEAGDFSQGMAAEDHEHEMADLRLELSSLAMDLDTAIEEKRVLEIGIREARALYKEGNLSASQTLLEELIKE